MGLRDIWFSGCACGSDSGETQSARALRSRRRRSDRWAAGGRAVEERARLRLLLLELANHMRDGRREDRDGARSGRAAITPDALLRRGERGGGGGELREAVVD